ncbi:glycosyltransferase family 4 protein [Marinomonas sp. PE14-40]|uniref:glycosyltransferase family 4 protein n=1 Tax=Marinomonas sp. PE14-40 TaxID=3060621 RepID=UPI003F66A074
MEINQTRIYQLVDSRSCGGIESHILELSSWLVSHQLNVEIIFLQDHGEHPLKQQLALANVPWSIKSSWPSLMKKIKANHGLLATHGYKAGIMGRIMAKIYQIPVVSTYHSGDLGKGRLYLYSKLDDLTAGMANEVFCVSEEIQSRLPVKSNLIANFTQLANPPKHLGSKIAFVGRLSQEKGPDSFVQIAQEALLRTNTKLSHEQICLYGQGPMHEELASNYPKDWFAGYSSMSEHWHDIGLLCITSRHEGLPLVALEAMAHGIPVMSFKVGALPQLISEGKDGWIIENQNKRDFIEKLVEWSQLNDDRKWEFSQNTRQKIQTQFSSDTLIPHILSVYNQALQTH